MVITVDATKTDDLFSDSKPMSKIGEDNRRIIRDWFATHDGETYDYQWAYTAVKELGRLVAKPKPAKAQFVKAVVNVFGIRDPEAQIAVDDKGETVYDPELNDKENIPWGMDPDEYMKSEVLPYAPETGIDTSVKDTGPMQDGETGVVGTSISFNRYFYQYEQPRNPKEIATEILDLEDGLESFMKGFLR